MVNKPVSARHHLASLALAVLATFSTGLHAQTTIAAGDTTYRGAFTTDTKTGAVNGSGTVQWKNGNRYEGPVVNTQLTGKGNFTWANGDTYVGDMVNAQPHGQGTYTFKSGDRYVGAWRNGQKHGQGRYTFANGSVWEGEFANDQQFKQGAVAVTAAPEATNPAPTLGQTAISGASPTITSVSGESNPPTANTSEPSWTRKKWEIRRATEEQWGVTTWIFHPNGTAQSEGLWKGTWNQLTNGRVRLTFTITKPVAYDIEFSATANSMTLYRDGTLYAYGRVRPTIEASSETQNSLAQEDPNYKILAAQFEQMGDKNIPADAEFAKYFNAARPLPDTVCSQHIFAQLARMGRHVSPIGNAFEDKRLGNADYLKFLNQTPHQLGMLPADVRKAFAANKRLEQENKYSLSLLTNASCDRVLVRYARVAWMSSGKQAVEVSYADIQMKFPFTHVVASVAGRARNNSTWFEPGIDAVQQGVPLYRNKATAHVILDDALFYRDESLEDVFRRFPDKIRSADPWPPETKAEIASMEKARNEQLARAEAERKAKEAREAEQARLAAIESDKRRKQEQARFDAAMNAKDPQAMYLAAGKYEREGDSYSARKVYEQIIDRFPSSPFAAKANDQLLANQRSDKARSDLFDAQRDAQRQQGEAAYKACMVDSDACYRRNNSFKGCTLPSECNSLR